MKLIPFHGCIPKHMGNSENEKFIQKIREDFDPAMVDLFYTDIPEVSFFIYKIITPEVSICGLVCLVENEAALSGKFHQHEAIITSKYKIIQSLINKAEAVIKPIMAFYENADQLTSAIVAMAINEHKIFEMQIGNEMHQIYKVPASYQAQISTLSNDLKEIFIADGHHRYKALSELSQTEKGPAGIFTFLYDASMVYLKPYNRAATFTSEEALKEFVSHLEGISGSKSSCSRHYFPKEKGEVVLVLAEESWCYRLTEADQSVTDIDLMNKKIFALYDKPRPFSFEFLNPEETEEKLSNPIESHEVVLLFHAISADEIIKATKAKAIFPPKSTWFYPKVRSGIIVSLFK